MPQPQAKNIWNFIENSVDDFGNGLAVGALGGAYLIYWLGDKAAEALRPTFGQSSGEVVLGAGLTAVTAAGVTYVIRKRKNGGDDSGNGPHRRGGNPNQPNPQPPILERIFNMVQRRQLTAAMPPDTAVSVTQAANDDEDTAVSGDTSLNINNPVAMFSEALHLLLVGYTGGGKTTLSHAIAMHLVRNGSVTIVMDPDAAPGLWRGCHVVGAGDNYEAINNMILRLKKEVTHRRQLRAAGQRHHEPLYVVMDEYADIHKNCSDARPFVEDLLRRGRKLNIHLFMGVQDKLVETLGFQGQGELRRHFTYVVDVAVDQATKERSLTIDQNNDRSSSYTIPTPRLPDLDKLIIPMSVNGNHKTVAERLGIRPSMPIITLDAPTVPVPATVPAPVILPIPRLNGAGMHQNGREHASENGKVFLPGTQQERPLTADMVARFMELRYEQHPDFANAPPSLDKDRVVTIAVCLYARMDENPIMRGIGWTPGGRYRQYIKLVREHLDFLEAQWKRREALGHVKQAG